MEAMVTIESRWNTQSEEIRSVFTVFEIEQIIVIHAQTLYDWHVV